MNEHYWYFESKESCLLTVSSNQLPRGNLQKFTADSANAEFSYLFTIRYEILFICRSPCIDESNTTMETGANGKSFNHEKPAL